MKYIESPEQYSPKGGDCVLFLAGGITGCPDWQHEIVSMLGNVNVVLLNPRRANFPIHDPNAAPTQVRWEFDHLRKATAVLFWFPEETPCPIVLYELGAWSMTDKPLFVGVHPNYPRRLDVELQTKFSRPHVNIVYTLESLAKQVANWVTR